MIGDRSSSFTGKPCMRLLRLGILQSGIILGLLGLGLIWGYFPGQAQTVDQLRTQQQQLQQKLQTNQQQLETLQQQEQAAQQNIDAIRNSLQQTDTRIQDNEYRLQQAQQDLERAQQDLEELEAKLARQQAGTAARLRYLQRHGAERWWALLLSSQDLNEFFDRRHQLGLLIESDRALISELQETASLVEEQRVVLEARKNEIALILQELAAQKQQQQQRLEAQKQLVERITTQRSAYEAAQRRLQADSRQIGSLIQRLIAEAEAQQQSAPAQAPAVTGTGRLVRPVAGPMTSPFGWRIHPVYRTRRFHAGLDFGVATGTPVGAADRGTVLYSGWYGGYGYTVILNHGNGLTTLYAHNSSLLVRQGQTVQRGQAIARSGSTGLSTGPHVHFEVRVQGQPVDPRRYI